MENYNSMESPFNEEFTEEDYELYKELYEINNTFYLNNKRHKKEQSVFDTISEVMKDDFLPDLENREEIIDYICKAAGNVKSN